jgi:tetracycline 7-halogenase / FADH2 O2-dependent halogenase
MHMTEAAERYDLAVVGSGYAGSLMAMIARRLGYSVVLIERGRHPRIVIGESSTPLSNLLLEELADRYNLAEIRPLSKWGTWQRADPEIACGLKRGFTFYHHSLDTSGLRDAPDIAAPLQDRARQLLVAASPRDAIADTHWYRADFDAFLMQAAVRSGAAYYDQIELRSFTDSGAHVLIEGCRRKPGPQPPGPPRPCAFRARFVVDATGPRGFLSHALHLGELPIPAMPPTQALYTHFCGVARIADLQKAGAVPPYPPDDAAVHHIFPGGWIWVLRFNNGLTSAGAALTDETAARFGLSPAPASPDAQPRYAAAWNQILARIPLLQAQFSRARLPKQTHPFTHIPRLSFRSAQIAGPRWALLPSAAGFVDPLLSTGFPLTLLGVQRLAAILESGPDAPDLAPRLSGYAAQTDAELLAAAGLIAALYAAMDNFPVFTALTMLYFAAVSYAEAAHRLGRPELAGSFLLRDHPVFGPAMRGLLARAASIRNPEQTARFTEEVRRAIAPINIAGLADPARQNWYPVDAADLLANGHKLHATRDAVEALLDRCGFYGDGSVPPG